MKKDINNPDLIAKLIRTEKAAEEQYYRDNPDSLIPKFEEELRTLGFEFEISNQSFKFMPKYKKVILPIAVKYYQLAKEKAKPNEQQHFLRFFQFKGFDEVVPLLLQDFHNEEPQSLTCWFIANCLYQIRAKKFINEYLEIATNKAFGQNRQMIILLLGKLKDDSAIPTLIELLEDEEVRLQVICALGDFKKDDFRCHFNRFLSSDNSGWRKQAKVALEKLNK